MCPSAYTVSHSVTQLCTACTKSVLQYRTLTRAQPFRLKTKRRKKERARVQLLSQTLFHSGKSPLDHLLLNMNILKILQRAHFDLWLELLLLLLLQKKRSLNESHWFEPSSRSVLPLTFHHHCQTDDEMEMELRWGAGVKRWMAPKSQPTHSCNQLLLLLAP